MRVDRYRDTPSSYQQISLMREPGGKEPRVLLMDYLLIPDRELGPEFDVQKLSQTKKSLPSLTAPRRRYP
jgi:hypothetical protein